MSSVCAQAETHSTATSSQKAWLGPTTKAPRLAPPKPQEPVPLETGVKEGRYLLVRVDGKQKSTQKWRVVEEDLPECTGHEPEKEVFLRHGR